MNLGELVYKTASRLGVVIEGIATGGTTTSVIDTTATSSKEFGNKIDDFYNGGTVGIMIPTGSINAWEYQEVSDYDQSAFKLYTESAFSAAVVAGDRYWLAKKNTPAKLLEQKINQVLGETMLIVEDSTTITTASNQLEYSLPADASLDLRRVEIQTITGDSNRNQWEDLADWDILRTAVGTADKLVLRQQPKSGLAIKVTYAKPHPVLTTYSSSLDGSVHGDRVAIRAAMRYIEDRLEVDPRQELQNRWNLLADALSLIEAGWKNDNRFAPQATSKLNSRWGRTDLGSVQRSNYPGDQTVY